MAGHAPFLKLHGSLGWFVHSGYFIDGTRLSGAASEYEGKTVLQSGTHWFGVPDLTHRGEVLLPILVTPILHKAHNDTPFFRAIWEEARRHLRTCKRLVIGGYSFPPTDFHTRRLLRECFWDHSPDELCIINPDRATDDIAKELCNYRRPVLQCSDLNEFLRRDA
jgi:hypothetical protein